jgi:ribosomal protein S18 acetylase RimI-like enzyme
MTMRTADLYRVEKKDIQKAGVVLADAFEEDPFWKILLADADVGRRQIYFESPVRYCLKYGEVYASSEHLEGIIAWVPSGYADMTFWRAIRCGSFRSLMKTGAKMMKQLAKLTTIFGPLEAERRANMAGRSYLYFIIIGVATDFQGQGHGKKMIDALIQSGDEGGLPLYVETTTERNVRMYERLGFTVLSRIILPVINLPQWGMVYEHG